MAKIQLSLFDDYSDAEFSKKQLKELRKLELKQKEKDYQAKYDESFKKSYQLPSMSREEYSKWVDECLRSSMGDEWVEWINALVAETEEEWDCKYDF